MSKKLFLSHSQINTYKDCARKWYLDKQQRLRPNWKGSALLFGSALDSAVEHILLKKEGTFVEAFLGAMKEFDVNAEDKVLPKDILDVRFTAGDVDISILEGTLMSEVEPFCESLKIEMPDLHEFLEYCKQQRKNKNALEKNEQKLFNFIAYQSLKAKGLMLLEKLEEWIEENVQEVHEVQKKIDIENDDGDRFIGFLDFIVTLKSGKKVLVDLKTSSNTNAYYPADSAETSVQLGIYSQETGVDDVAYLVADKKIRKREPRVRLTFIEGKITEEHLDEVFEGIEEATNEIKQNLEKGEEGFPKNLDSCMKFGGCQYFNFCKKGDMKGLCYVKKV